jgi:hypothetical protein
MIEPFTGTLSISSAWLSESDANTCFWKKRSTRLSGGIDHRLPNSFIHKALVSGLVEIEVTSDSSCPREGGAFLDLLEEYSLPAKDSDSDEELESMLP